MQTGSHPDGPDPHPRVDRLGVECDEADRLGKYQERIWLGFAGLCGQGSTAEEPERPAQEQKAPTPPASSHVVHSVRLYREDSIGILAGQFSPCVLEVHTRSAASSIALGSLTVKGRIRLGKPGMPGWHFLASHLELGHTMHAHAWECR
jgi:hypothetical protein